LPAPFFASLGLGTALNFPQKVGKIAGRARLKSLTRGGLACDILRVAKNGAPDRIRTYDLCLRRAALYPAELRVRAIFGRSGSRRRSARSYKENELALQSEPGFA
jgi:hypothetical protein